MKNKAGTPKVLLYDIEIVQRNLGDSWRTMGADHSFITAFGYRWEHEKKNHVIDLHTTNSLKNLDPFNDTADRKVVVAAHKIMSQADMSVGHYATNFDWKYMNAKFDYYGLPSLSHIPKRDTCMKARSMYKLSSKRLGNLCNFLGIPTKIGIDHKLWFSLYQGGSKATMAMKKISKYCKGDVEALFGLYQKLKPHWPAYYHTGIMSGKSQYASCPECGSLDIIKRKPYVTAAGVAKYRMSCKACNRWFVLNRSGLLKHAKKQAR